MSANDSLRILSFVLGCGLAGGASLHLILWMALNSPARLPDEMRVAPWPVVFRRYFRLPMIAIGIGLIGMIVPFLWFLW